MTHITRFADLLGRLLGLHFDESRSGLLAEVLESRAAALAVPTATFLDRLAGNALAKDELRRLARDLTVGETYFFRHVEQFRAFAEVALPDRLAARPPSRPVRILSAGCASGEEPYTLAILAIERTVDPAHEVTITGLDVNPEAIEKAARGRYSTWSLRATPDDMKRRWFAVDRNEVVVDRRLRDAVALRETNLVEENAELWQPGAYDVVFCRNVIMYFTPDAQKRLISRIISALAPGGYLFLGHAETLRGLSDACHLRHSHETFYYQRRDGHAEPPEPSPRRDDPPPSAPPADPGGSTTWIETINKASERIHELSRKAAAVSATMERPPARAPASGLGMALALLEEERFAEALGLLDQLPPDRARDKDVLLLRAVLSTHAGKVAAAEATCRELLELDELAAAAHYVLALCRESVGDVAGALDHDRVALYLDPGFSMARLHLGLMARRAGDNATAERELRQAIVLLEREDAARLLLFGGGFGRDGLVALCRAELGRLEARR